MFHENITLMPNEAVYVQPNGKLCKPDLVYNYRSLVFFQYLSSADTVYVLTRTKPRAPVAILKKLDESIQCHFVDGCTPKQSKTLKDLLPGLKVFECQADSPLAAFPGAWPYVPNGMDKCVWRGIQLSVFFNGHEYLLEHDGLVLETDLKVSFRSVQDALQHGCDEIETKYQELKKLFIPERKIAMYIVEQYSSRITNFDLPEWQSRYVLVAAADLKRLAEQTGNKELLAMSEHRIVDVANVSRQLESYDENGVSDPFFVLNQFGRWLRKAIYGNLEFR